MKLVSRYFLLLWLILGCNSLLSGQTALVEDFSVMRQNGKGDPMWEATSNKFQETSIVSEDGDLRLRDVITGESNSGPGSLKHLQIQFTPNQGAPRYPWPAGYTQTYIKSGAWDEEINRLSFWLKCDKDISWNPRENLILGTYIKKHDHTDENWQGAHYYNFISMAFPADRWTKIQMSWHPGTKVGQSGSIEWGSDPEYPNGQGHYFDSLTRFYLDMKYCPSFPCTCYIDDFVFSKQPNQNDEYVPSMAAAYTGSRYRVGFNTIKNESQDYEIRYSTESMKANGFESGELGGVVSNIAGAYTGAEWESPAMEESSGGMYFAIRPVGHTEFMELFLPPGAPSASTILSSTQPADCDANGDSVTDAEDVELMVDASLGIAPCSHDLNGDGQCDAVDVQRVTNAALGEDCLVD